MPAPTSPSLPLPESIGPMDPCGRSDKEGIAHALAAKLDAAEASEERGNSSAKAGELKAFANQVNAQTGKAFTPNHALVLLTLARTL